MTKKSGMELWPCRNRREKNLFQLVCDNAIAEIEGKKIVGMNLWQWHCRNRMKKKSLQLVCGNGIAEIDERYKKKYAYSYSFSIFFY